MGDLQSIGNKALQNAPPGLRRALDGLNTQFRQESGPTSPMAGGLGPGNRGMIAGVAKGSPNTISVMQPDVFAKNADQLATHEGLHEVQNNWAPAIQRAIPPDNPSDPYNYGGPARIAQLLKSGGTIANLPREQASAALQYGQSQGMPEPYRSLDQTIDKVPLSTVDMTDPMAKTINTHPRAPQVPPSGVPGMNFANTIYQPGQPAPGDDSLLPPDMQPQAQPSAAPIAKTLNPLQQNIANDQQALQKVQWAQKNPWGTANNHPGTMGKIAHVLSVAGNVAGDIFAPNTMAMIPGTELHNQVEGDQLTVRLNREQEEESQNEGRDATTQATQLANAAEPQRAADAHSLTQSTIAKNEADAQPKAITLQQAHANAVNKALQEGRDPSTDPTVNHLADAITSLQKQPAEQGVGKATDIKRPDGQIHTMGYDQKTGKYDIDNGVSGFKPAVTNLNAGRTQDRAERNDVLKAYQPTLDSAERMNVMTESYEKAIKDHDQQAMLNLLANHLGMTMGLQKGARMTKDIVNEAKQSQPWLQGIESKFDKDGYLSGVTLSPNQMRQMVALGQSRYAEDAKKSRATAQYMGAPDDGPDRIPGTPTMHYYLGLAHGDPAKAKQLAGQDGWTVK